MIYNETKVPTNNQEKDGWEGWTKKKQTHIYHTKEVVMKEVIMEKHVVTYFDNEKEEKKKEKKKSPNPNDVVRNFIYRMDMWQAS